MKKTALLAITKFLKSYGFYIIGIGIFYYIGSKIYKIILEQMENSENADVCDDSGVTLSYPIGTFKQFDIQLHSAMDYGGTDPEAIKVVFDQLNNCKDVQKLIKVFGTPDYYDWDSWLGSPASLGQWLRYELGTSDIETYVNEPLRSKGIDHQF